MLQKMNAQIYLKYKINDKLSYLYALLLIDFRNVRILYSCPLVGSNLHITYQELLGLLWFRQQSLGNKI